MAIFKRGNTFWFKFAWNGQLVRRSTRQGNARIARQTEAAHRTALARGEVGLREQPKVPTLAEFATHQFLPYVSSTFAAKPKTLEYYQYGVKSILGSGSLRHERLDSINSQKISAFAAERRQKALQVSSINRELGVLRRMLRLALEWGKTEKAIPVRMLPGERHRDRVLRPDEEKRYLASAPPLLRDVATLLIDCGLRPEECSRLRWENIKGGAIHIPHGKTESARRRIPMTPRVAALLDMRRTCASSLWVFPALTKSGHIEKSSLRKQHRRGCRQAKVDPFVLYDLRHTCLTRWAPEMDAYTLAYLAGHSDMATTRRYVHPQDETVREALERARGGHKIGHSGEEELQADERQLPLLQ